MQLLCVDCTRRTQRCCILPNRHRDTFLEYHQTGIYRHFTFGYPRVFVIEWLSISLMYALFFFFFVLVDSVLFLCWLVRPAIVFCFSSSCLSDIPSAFVQSYSCCSYLVSCIVVCAIVVWVLVASVVPTVVVCVLVWWVLIPFFFFFFFFSGSNRWALGATEVASGVLMFFVPLGSYSNDR